MGWLTTPNPLIARQHPLSVRGRLEQNLAVSRRNAAPQALQSRAPDWARVAFEPD